MNWCQGREGLVDGHDDDSRQGEEAAGRNGEKWVHAGGRVPPGSAWSRTLGAGLSALPWPCTWAQYGAE